ncbi:glycine cleavage system protein GcvH [Massilibacterium senegalense]|uniref:glycine cleavage system protein GcvH n=1 Tax=Massilibacterium senegalense TaxID=1632858 RepID=UPI000782D325|nr:glycine cleavage system protein GcvH [Massilibacterium senegalense]
MSIPNNLRYSKEHEWVKVEDGKVIVGITEFAQSELGDIVFVDLPETDEIIAPNESFGSVESVKTVSELYAPVGGKIVAVNEELEDAPELVNESPYENGWMIEIKADNLTELDALLTAEQYEAFIKGDE